MSAMRELDDCLFEVPEHWWRRRRCQVCGGALSVVHAHLYVVQRQRWVKVGTTDNLRRRINELSRPAWAQHLISPPGMDWREPLTTLGVVVDGGADEHQLHQHFAELHVAGEWFLPNRSMRNWFRHLPSLEEVSP